jgi:hypothetical protein
MTAPHTVEVGLRQFLLGRFGERRVWGAALIGQSLVPLTALAEAQRIPGAFLEQILIELRQAGFLASTRVKYGGYSLARLLRDLKSDAIAGLIAAIVALPLSMAIAIASGVTPDRGLYTAIVGGFIVSAIGGSRFQIGGPAGAFRHSSSRMKSDSRVVSAVRSAHQKPFSCCSRSSACSAGKIFLAARSPVAPKNTRASECGALMGTDPLQFFWEASFSHRYQNRTLEA